MSELKIFLNFAFRRSLQGRFENKCWPLPYWTLYGLILNILSAQGLFLAQRPLGDKWGAGEQFAARGTYLLDKNCCQMSGFKKKKKISGCNVVFSG